MTARLERHAGYVRLAPKSAEAVAASGGCPTGAMPFGPGLKPPARHVTRAAGSVRHVGGSP